MLQVTGSTPPFFFSSFFFLTLIILSMCMFVLNCCCCYPWHTGMEWLGGHPQVEDMKWIFTCCYNLLVLPMVVKPKNFKSYHNNLNLIELFWGSLEWSGWGNILFNRIQTFRILSKPVAHWPWNGLAGEIFCLIGYRHLEYCLNLWHTGLGMVWLGKYSV